jgi:ABC-type dipeptide/oligopeptide/nickel transport system permease subunit
VIIVNVTFNIADAILAVAYLGFLGLGLHYPSYTGTTCCSPAPNKCWTATGG